MLTVRQTGRDGNLQVNRRFYLSDFLLFLFHIPVESPSLGAAQLEGTPQASLPDPDPSEPAHEFVFASTFTTLCPSDSNTDRT